MIWTVAALAQQPLVLDGEVGAGGLDFVFVPFEVPAGTAELQVEHESLSASVLDWGLLGPDGHSRGWGGGNPEDIWITAADASRSYRPGLPPGTWQVVIGKARLEQERSPYRLRVTVLEQAVHDPPQPREPYAHAEPLEVGARWYAGDLHVHSRESGDATPTLDAIAALARERGLDFVVLTEHNTVSGLDLIAAAQRRNPDVLLVPGVEFTTYRGHLNALGSTVPLDHLLGVDGHDLAAVFDAIRGDGGVVSINHPALDLADRCIGCPWEHPLDGLEVDAVEVQTGGLLPAGGLFTDAALDFFDALCTPERCPAAVGGSDDHRAGDGGFLDSPIGDPATLVWAEALSVPALIDGIRQARTVVKLQGPDDPMIELEVSAAEAIACVVDADADRVRFVVDGLAGEPIQTAPASDCPAQARVARPPGATWVRAEAWTGEGRRTVTSHARFVDPEGDAAGCGCAAGRPAGAIVLVGVFGLARRRRRAAPQ